MNPELLEYLLPIDPAWKMFAIGGGLAIFVLGIVIFGRRESTLPVYAAAAVGLAVIGAGWYQETRIENRVAEARTAVADELQDQYGYKLSELQASALRFSEDGQTTVQPTAEDGTIPYILLRIIDGELKAFALNDEADWEMVDPDRELTVE